LGVLDAGRKFKQNRRRDRALISLGSLMSPKTYMLQSFAISAYGVASKSFFKPEKKRSSTGLRKKGHSGHLALRAGPRRASSDHVVENKKVAQNATRKNIDNL